MQTNCKQLKLITFGEKRKVFKEEIRIFGEKNHLHHIKMCLYFVMAKHPRNKFSNLAKSIKSIQWELTFIVK